MVKLGSNASYSTFRDLKEATERALRKTYYVMHDFHVERLPHVEAKDVHY